MMHTPESDRADTHLETRVKMSKMKLDSPSLFVKDTLFAPGFTEAHDPWRYVDMHCHLDRMANAAEVATHAQERRIAILCTTVTPDDVASAQDVLAESRNVRIAAGLHPWWVTDGPKGTADAAQAAALAAVSDYVGEIGLDFSPAHKHNARAQIAAFERIVSACAAKPRRGRVISIHAVRAASDVLDMLEAHGLPDHATCIFHWFSGTSVDLDRIRRLGCHISVNERMLATKRGREYARQMPLEQLHLETDAPPQAGTPPHADTSPQARAPYPVDELERSLNRTLEALARIRGIEQEELAALMAQASSKLIDI